MGKKILIDANSLISLYTRGFLYGVGRSTFELLKAISEIKDLPIDIEIFSQNLKGVNSKGDIKLKTRHFYIPNRNSFKRISHFFKLKKLIIHYDLLHVPHNTDLTESLSKTIFTIHDLIVYHYPEMWGVCDNDLRSFEKIAKGCKHIITCSESSKKDIIRFWGLNESKVSVIHWGINRDVFKHTLDCDVLKKYNLGEQYFFSASCNHPRKNTGLILAAFRDFLNKGGQAQLVLLSPLVEEIKPYMDLVNSQKIVICKGISDYDLNVLYSMAHFTIMVSKYEGFGFPVLESLACGTQVVAYNGNAIAEVGGNVVEYIDDLTSKDLSDKMLELGSKNKESFTNLNSIEDHLSLFTWENCAKKYIELYSHLLSE